MMNILVLARYEVGNHFRGNRSANVDRLSLQIPAPDRVKVVAQMGCMVNTNFESDRFQTFFCELFLQKDSFH